MSLWFNFAEIEYSIMFKWNPFAAKKEEAPAQPAATSGDALPTNEALLEAIQNARLDTLMGDMRPMHRALLEAKLFVPLHEPPSQESGGMRLRYMTFEDDRVMCVFTDKQRMREYFLSGGREEGVHIWFASGQEVCGMATRAGLDKIIINPNSDILYAMPPLVFRVLAEGWVPGSVSDEAIPSGQVIIGKPISGLPDETMLQIWRDVLKGNGVTEAYWFNAVLPEANELRYAFAVACESEQLAKVESDLKGAWLGKWPVNTPLFVCQLKDDPQSHVIREGGAQILP